MWLVVRGAARLFILATCLPAAPVTGTGQEPSAEVLQQHAQVGERALAAGRYAEAEKAYETLRKLSPGTAEVHARLGLIYFQQGKFAEAIPALREAIRLKPGLPNVDALLAMSLSELGKYDEALPVLEKAFAGSKDAALRRMAGLHLQRSYSGMGRDQDAAEVALRLSRLHPDDPEILYHSGRLLANLAYLQTMRLAAVAPESVWLHLAAGEANESQGLFDAAVREYRQVVALTPRRPGVHFRLGRALVAKAQNVSAEDLAEARKAFEEELRIDPSNANAAYEIGEMHRKAGELEPARAMFEQALQHYPAFGEALVGLGRTLLALGRPADALPRLEAALKHDPEDEVAHYQLAQAYRALGRTAEQERALAEFTRLRTRAEQRRAAIPPNTRDVTRQELESKTRQ